MRSSLCHNGKSSFNVNLCKMNITLFKQIKTVKNAAQAGDAVLAFHYSELVDDVEIFTQERAPLDNSYFHGKNELTLWGTSKEFFNVPLLDHGSFATSLEALKFSMDEIKKYSHFIVSGISASSDSNGKSRDFVRIYPLDDLDHYQIVMGYF